MKKDYSTLSRRELIAAINSIEMELGKWISAELLPRIAALENERLIKMYYQDTFLEEFQRRYFEAQRKGLKPTYKDIYYEMDEIWFRATGQHRYNDFYSFYTVYKRGPKTHAKKSASRQIHAKEVGQIS